MSGEAGVKVFCRFRPFNKREIELGADKAVDFQVRTCTHGNEGCLELFRDSRSI